MSNLWRSSTATAAQPIGLGGIGASTAAMPRPRFRALYAVEEAPRVAPVAVEEPVDEIEQLRVEAFTLGYEEGSRITAEAMAADQEACDRLAEALAQLAPASGGALPSLLSAAVLRLVEQIVGEVEVDTALLLQRCEAIAAFIEEGEARTALHLNPEDIPLIEGAGIGVPLLPDPALRRGSVRLDTSEGWIEDGPDVRLSRLRAMMDDMEGRA